MTLPSMKTSARSGSPASLISSNRRSQTPLLPHRMKRWAHRCQGPNSGGTARHLAPFRSRHDPLDRPPVFDRRPAPRWLRHLQSGLNRRPFSLGKHVHDRQAPPKVLPERGLGGIHIRRQTLALLSFLQPLSHPVEIVR